MASLLTIMELGGYPDFSSRFSGLGFDVTNVNSMRKGLIQIKKQPPDVIIAQFIYGPTYGSQLSNFEALLAAIQRYATGSKLIALLEKDDIKHLQRLGDAHLVFQQYVYPLDTQAIVNDLRPLAIQSDH